MVKYSTAELMFSKLISHSSCSQNGLKADPGNGYHMKAWEIVKLKDFVRALLSQCPLESNSSVVPVPCGCRSFSSIIKKRVPVLRQRRLLQMFLKFAFRADVKEMSRFICSLVLFSAKHHMITGQSVRSVTC